MLGVTVVRIILVAFVFASLAVCPDPGPAADPQPAVPTSKKRKSVAKRMKKISDKAVQIGEAQTISEVVEAVGRGYCAISGQSQSSLVRSILHQCQGTIKGKTEKLHGVVNKVQGSADDDDERAMRDTYQGLRSMNVKISTPEWLENKRFRLPPPPLPQPGTSKRVG